MKLSEEMRKRNAGLNNAFEYADEVAKLEAIIDKIPSTIYENICDELEIDIEE